jgi:hypothetical protein
MNVKVAAAEFPTSRALRRPKKHSFELDPYCQTLSSESLRLAQDLVSRLSRPSNDVRTHLHWAYGLFLQYLPIRLGYNKALDAATRTLLDLHTEACTFSHKQTHRKMLLQYSAAIKAVRDVLDDPEQAARTDTLAAVVLLGCCQVESMLSMILKDSQRSGTIRWTSF